MSKNRRHIAPVRSGGDVMDSEDTLQRLVKRDETVLAELLSTYGEDVRHVLRQRFGDVLDEDDLDDIQSVALFSIWRATEEEPLRPIHDFGAWFYVIARNAAIDLLRRLSRYDLELASGKLGEWIKSQGPSAAGSSDEPESAGASRQNKAAEDLGHILAELPEADRRILLAYVDARQGRLDAQALSDELGMSIGNIRVRRFRLLKRIRREMERLGHSLADPNRSQSSEKRK